MENIRESLRGIQSLSSFISEAIDAPVNEGLKDILNTVKRKFKQAVQWLKGVVARCNSALSYWLPIGEDGKPMNAISPLTAAQAWADGKINKANTAVIVSSKAKSITGCSCGVKDAKNCYGPGNSLDYWRRMVSESNSDSIQAMVDYFCGVGTVNEVKMHTDDPTAKYNVYDNDQLKSAIGLSLKNKKLKPLLIFGAPGIGKTAILMSVLDSFPGGNEYSLIVKTLSNETPDNFTLPKYIEIDGQEKATDVPKTWLPVYKPTGDTIKDQELDDACGKGLLFIDELSRATPQVLNVMLPLINERQFNGYKLGSGWVVICASNRAEDEMSGQSTLGNALMNRFRVCYYEPTVKTWKKWAETQGYMSPLLLSWLSMPESESMSGGKYFYYDPNESGELENPAALMCTPRSWTDAMHTLCAYAETASLEGFSLLDIPRDLLTMALSEHIPTEAIDSFLAFIEVIGKIGDFDAAVRGAWENGKMVDIKKRDLQMIALPLAQLLITSHAKTYPTAEEFTNFAKALVAADSDQLASYALDILQHVFGGTIDIDQHRSNIFFMPEKIAAYKKNKPASLNAFKNIYKNFCAKWGFSDLEECPSWYKGFQLISKKYGDSFSAAKVGDLDGLG